MNDELIKNMFDALETFLKAQFDCVIKFDPVSQLYIVNITAKEDAVFPPGQKVTGSGETLQEAFYDLTNVICKNH